jgi:DNA-binding NarL/FixJ family response regulator
LLQQKLSHRETQIALLMNAGLVNKEIAERLFISEKTVKTHVSNILNKMGLKDRMQLMVFCRQHNIV